MVKQKGSSEGSVCLFVYNHICLQFYACSPLENHIFFKNVLTENLKVAPFLPWESCQGCVTAVYWVGTSENHPGISVEA